MSKPSFPVPLAAIAVALTVIGCKREPAPRPTPSANTQPTPSPLVDAAAPSARPAIASDAGTRAPKLDGHCKALGGKAAAELEPIMESELLLMPQPDAIYALGNTHELARVRLYRFSRQGEAVEVVSEQKGIGTPKGFAVANGAGYYAQSGHLFKLGPEKGASVTLAEDVDAPVIIVGDQVLSIQCNRKGKMSRLISVPTNGGESKTVADLPHRAGERCQYSSIVADAGDVYVADWSSQQILRVSRVTGSVHPVVTKCGFAGTLVLEPDKLAYTCVTGLYEVARDGESPTRIVDNTIAMAPYSYVLSNQRGYWVFDNFAYNHPTTLRHLPRSGGAAQSFMVLTNRDPNAQAWDGDGLVDFAVDDECAYVAQKQFKRPGIRMLAKAVE